MNNEPFPQLRARVLYLDPASLRIHRTPSGLFGLVTEMGFDEGVATLVAIADGTVSVYFSNGGGVIGVGSQLGPRRAAEALLDEAPRFMSRAAPAKEFPLPESERVRFWFLTFDGVLGAEAETAALEENRSGLSRLYSLAQELLTEVRVVSEAGREP
ncbi:MAG TPA: hypothetical protein VLW85_01810 [Myxococcales bacterium]|nr:hypothetical protein [Myxococcales bacterium]